MNRVGAMSLFIALATATSGCAGGAAGEPSDRAPSSSTAATPRPSASSESPTGAVLLPEGTAADNLAIFTAVTESVWASSERGSGRAYIDALATAGFDKASMQVTADTSTVGNPAESIQFSVLWGEECLIGQVGPATGDPYTVVVPKLPEGGCLVGETRPIDW